MELAKASAHSALHFVPCWWLVSISSTPHRASQSIVLVWKNKSTTPSLLQKIKIQLLCRCFLHPKIPDSPWFLHWNFNFRVSIESSDRFKLSDTIHSYIKKWSVNAWNSHKWCSYYPQPSPFGIENDGLIISWYKIKWCPTGPPECITWQVLSHWLQYYASGCINCASAFEIWAPGFKIAPPGITNDDEPLNCNHVWY